MRAGLKENLNSNKYGNIQQLFDIQLYGRGKAGVLTEVEKYLKNKPDQNRPFWIATVNTEFVMATFAKATEAKGYQRSDFLKVLQKTDLNTIDGIGLVWAKEMDSRFKAMDPRIKNKLARAAIKTGLGFAVGVEVLRGDYKDNLAAGADLVTEASGLAARKGWKVFLLGGFKDRAKRSAENLKRMNEGLQIDSCEGEPSISNDMVLDRISQFKPDLLFVAYGMKRQEEWIERNLDKLPSCVVMGVGRTFDYLSDDLVRATEIWRSKGLEWLFSLVKEPKRWRRQLALPRFIWKVLST